MIVLGSILLNLYMFQRLFVAYRLEKQRTFEQQIKFEELSSLVFQNACFMDAKGIAQGDYDKAEVQRKWDLFHKITKEFYSSEST